MSSVLTYTVGGNIRNRTANLRGRSAVREWIAYEDNAETHAETGAETHAETRRPGSTDRRYSV